MRSALILLSAIGLLPLACVTYREDLNRGQRMYEQNKYEHALALWRALEDDTDSLSANDQARYAYLRGMTDYRLGFRAEARHWLAIAKASDQAPAAGLRADWKERMEQSLSDLNQEAYSGGERFDNERSADVEATTPSLGGKGLGADTPMAAPPTGRCRSNADCPAPQICDGIQCTPL